MIPRALLLCLLACAVPLAAFEVTMDINDGHPLVDKDLIFAKDKGHAGLTFGGSGGGALSYAPDGAIVSTITGGGKVAPRIAWSSGGVDVQKYTYLVLVCRLEGTVHEDHGKGRTSDRRADNLWFAASLYNAAGERIGAVSLADVNPAHEGVTPAETTELRIPMILFRGGGTADKVATAIGTDWGPTHPNQSRDFRWVIDRIAFAD